MAAPAHKLFIDFDKDLDFSGSNEDITADVRNTGIFSYKVVRGKNLLKQRAEASSLELFLNNDDHKFSPFNPASPLHDPATNTSVFPAPDIWFLVGYPVDDFNVADTTTLTNRKPSHDSDANSWAGDTGSFEVDTNQVKSTSAANLTATIDFEETDCFCGVYFTRTGSNSGLIVRWSDASNFLMVRNDGSTLFLTKVDGGSASTVASVGYTWASGAKHWIFVETHGDFINVMIDQFLMIDTSSSFNNTATKYGIGGRATDTSDRWDDFGGWRSLFRGRIDAIVPRPEVNNQYAYIRAFDDLEKMKAHQVFRTAPAVSGDGTDAKAIIDVILDAASVQAGWVWDNYDWGDFTWNGPPNRLIDDSSGLSTPRFLTHKDQHRKSIGRDAATELYQVQDDDVGFFWIDGHGISRYEQPEHRNVAPHTKVVKVWNTQPQNNDQTDILIGQHFEWDDGKERVENEIWYFYHKISEVSIGVEVWRLNDTASILDDRPAIANGVTLSFLAVGDGDVIADPVTPIATTDFLVNTAKGGGGSDLTANVTAKVVLGFEGNFLLIELTNSSGSDGFITFF